MTNSTAATTARFTLRSAEMQAYYDESRKSGSLRELSEEPAIKEWNFWRLIENRFPYDTCFEIHRLLIPKRKVVSRADLNGAERAELADIVESYVEPNYDVIMDNTNRKRTVLNHYHMHVCVYRG